MPKQHREDRKSGNQTRAAWLLPVKKGVTGWLCLAVSVVILGAAGGKVWLRKGRTCPQIFYRVVFSWPRIWWAKVIGPQQVQ